MKRALYGLLTVIVFCTCTSKKKPLKDTSQYFPVKSYLQSLSKSLDTAAYSFTKIVTVNGRSDTTPSSLEEAKKYINEFVSIPDIKDPENGSKYDEVKNFDSLIGRAYISYVAEDQDVEVIRQEITVIPTLSGSDQVKTVYLEKLKTEKNDTEEKKMLWELGHFFSITTITQKAGKEEIHKLKIVFNKN